MTHPLDRLTDLVDGTLTAAERDEVLAHVRGCPRCAGEVAAATAGRDALRALPDTVTPPGLGSAAIAEAAEGATGVTSIRERATAPRWYRVAAGAGVAAAIVIAVAIALPKLDGTPSVTEDTTLGSVENAATPLVVEMLDEDFDFESVRALAEETGVAPTAPAGTSMAVDAGDPQGVGAAMACLTTAFEADPGEPVRLIEARFQGEPAYLGVFLRGPGAGQPPDSVQVLVATRPECRAVSSTMVRLPE